MVSIESVTPGFVIHQSVGDMLNFESRGRLAILFDIDLSNGTPFVGQSLHDRLHRLTWFAALRREFEQHDVATTGEPMHTQDRRGAIFFDNNIYPVMDESGKVESIAIYAKDVTDQHRARAVEDIFRHLDTVLLKWQMNLESIAQIFCDDILPVFDLPPAGVGGPGCVGGSLSTPCGAAPGREGEVGGGQEAGEAGGVLVSSLRRSRGRP